eukprot:83520-Chlamydomonas_euryale.AAC.1
MRSGEWLSDIGAKADAGLHGSGGESSSASGGDGSGGGDATQRLVREAMAQAASGAPLEGIDFKLRPDRIRRRGRDSGGGGERGGGGARNGSSSGMRARAAGRLRANRQSEQQAEDQ